MLATARLPGITVEPPPPQRESELFPRMDVALFIGFTARGPCHRPIQIDSVAAFEAVFGGKLSLAFDASNGETIAAHLAATVRSFFSNGGTTCWVIRVSWTDELADLWGAGSDISPVETSLLPLSGLLTRFPSGAGDTSRVRPAVLDASSGGSWADDMRITARLNKNAISVSSPAAFRWGLRFTNRNNLAPGDMIELRDRSSFTVRYAKIVRLDDGEAVACWISSFLEINGETPVKSGHAYIYGRRNRVDAQFWEGDECRVELSRDVPQLVKGRWVHFFQQGESIWLRADRVEGRVAFGPAWQQIGSRVPDDDFLANKLTLDVKVSEGETTKIVTNVGLAPEAPNSLYTLVSDDDFYMLDDNRIAKKREDFCISRSFRETYEQYKARRIDGDNFALLARKFGTSDFTLADRHILRAAWLPIGLDQQFVSLPTEAVNSSEPALSRDGLVPFDARLFIDPAFETISTSVLRERATQLHDLDGKQLFGMHGAFDIPGEPVGDVSIISIPDAVHPSWSLQTDNGAVPAPISPPYTPQNWRTHSSDCLADDEAMLEGPDFGSFLDSDVRKLNQPSFYGPRRPVTQNSFLLRWQNGDEGATYVLEEAGRNDFLDSVEIWRGTELNLTLSERADGVYYYRVRTELGNNVSGYAVRSVRVRASEYVAEEADIARLKRIHIALMRVAAGSSEMSSILSVPMDFRADEAADYVRSLSTFTSGSNLSDSLRMDEERTLSFAALYHPWIDGGRDVNLVTVPPDGAIAGTMARLAIDEGAWIAPANERFMDIIGLHPTIEMEDFGRMDQAKVNILRQFPRGFASFASKTLSDERDWGQVNVRRLMIMLRRIALKLGQVYLFEQNDNVTRRAVVRRLNERLDTMQRLGAFSGATSEESYFVRTPQTGNDLDNGRIEIALGVAPSHPLRFLNISLIQQGSRLTIAEGQ